MGLKFLVDAPIGHFRVGVSALARKTVSDNFKVFSERLSELMKERGLKQQDLANVLEVKRQTVSLYMSGQSMPDAEQLKNIAVFFNVSADWLLGLSEVRVLETDMREICTYTGLSEVAAKNLHKATNYNESPQIINIFFQNLLESSALYHLRDDGMRSALFGIQADKSGGVAPECETQEELQQYFREKWNRLFAEAAKPSGAASVNAEITAFQAEVLYRDRATRWIGRIVSKSISDYKKALRIKLDTQEHTE